jgi:hypothetical protein
MKEILASACAFRRLASSIDWGSNLQMSNQWRIGNEDRLFGLGQDGHAHGAAISGCRP